MSLARFALGGDPRIIISSNQTTEIPMAFQWRNGGGRVAEEIGVSEFSLVIKLMLNGCLQSYP